MSGPPNGRPGPANRDRARVVRERLAEHRANRPGEARDPWWLWERDLNEGSEHDEHE